MSDDIPPPPPGMLPRKAAPPSDVESKPPAVAPETETTAETPAAEATEVEAAKFPEEDPKTQPLSLSEMEPADIPPPPPPQATPAPPPPPAAEPLAALTAPPSNPPPAATASAEGAAVSEPPAAAEPAVTEGDLEAAGIKPKRGSLVPWLLLVLVLLVAGGGGYYGWTLFDAETRALATERTDHEATRALLATAAERADTAEARIGEVESEARDTEARLETETERLRGLLGPELESSEPLIEQLSAVSEAGTVRSTPYEVVLSFPAAEVFGDAGAILEEAGALVTRLLAALESFEQTEVTLAVRPGADDPAGRELAQARSAALLNHLGTEGGLAFSRLSASVLGAAVEGAPATVQVTVRPPRPLPPAAEPPEPTDTEDGQADAEEDADPEGEGTDAEGEAGAEESSD